MLLKLHCFLLMTPVHLGLGILCCIITYSLSVSSPDWFLKPGHCSLENHLRFPSLSSFGAMAGCGELTLFPHLITPLPTHPHPVQYDDTSLSDSRHSLCRHLCRPPDPWRDPSNPGSLAERKCLHFTAATWIFKFLLYLSPLDQANVLPFSTLLWHLSLGDFLFLSSLAQHSPTSCLLDLLIQASQLSPSMSLTSWRKKTICHLFLCMMMAYNTVSLTGSWIAKETGLWACLGGAF